VVSPVLAVSFGGSFLWGALAASSLLIGALIAMQFHISVRVIGAIMGFGAGVLISAVAFDLVEDSYDLARGGRAVGLGLIAGCATFAMGNFLIARLGGSQRKDPTGPGGGEGGDESGGALGIVLGSVLDGIPESMVIGLTLVGGQSLGISYLAAVFLSNLPEGISSTQGLLTAGWPKARLIRLWLLIVFVSALASLAGYGFLDTASPDVVAFVQSFAGGAILTMLADTMMPEAYEHGGAIVGVVTTLGFILAYTLHVLA
jgi:zinc transporter, ZIP family